MSEPIQYDLSNYEPVMIIDSPGHHQEKDIASLIDENKAMRQTIREHVKVFKKLQKLAIKHRAELPEELETFIFNK